VKKDISQKLHEHNTIAFRKDIQNLHWPLVARKINQASKFEGLIYFRVLKVIALSERTCKGIASGFITDFHTFLSASI